MDVNMEEKPKLYIDIETEIELEIFFFFWSQREKNQPFFPFCITSKTDATEKLPTAPRYSHAFLANRYYSFKGFFSPVPQKFSVYSPTRRDVHRLLRGIMQSAAAQNYTTSRLCFFHGASLSGVRRRIDQQSKDSIF